MRGLFFAKPANFLAGRERTRALGNRASGAIRIEVSGTEYRGFAQIPRSHRFALAVDALERCREFD